MAARTAPFGKGHTTAGLMGKLDTLTLSRKQHCMIADNVPGTDGFKPNRFGITLTRNTFTTIDRTSSNRAPTLLRQPAPAATLFRKARPS